MNDNTLLEYPNRYPSTNTNGTLVAQCTGYPKSTGGKYIRKKPFSKHIKDEDLRKIMFNKMGVLSYTDYVHKEGTDEHGQWWLRHFKDLDYRNIHPQQLTMFKNPIHGNFDLKLYKLYPNNRHVVEINVKWKVEKAEGDALSTRQVDEAVDRADHAIKDVWGHRITVNNVDIQVYPQIIRTHHDQHYTITVFPDSVPYPSGLRPDYLHVNQDKLTWNMRETFEFTKIDKFKKDIQKDKGPSSGTHEFGHMMGLPHDCDFKYSVMHWPCFESDGSDLWKYGGGNEPFIEHYKIVRLWLEDVFRTSKV
jgi:hypothetical protein